MRHHTFYLIPFNQLVLKIDHLLHHELNKLLYKNRAERLQNLMILLLCRLGFG